MQDERSGFPPGVRHLRCDNPGPMTLTGTNTYIVTGDDGSVLVVDPGPQAGGSSGHADAVACAVSDLGRDTARVSILLTHWHEDHAGGVDELAALLRQRGADVTVRGGGCGEPLHDKEQFGDLRVLATPGHTADSVSFVLDRDGRRIVFTGDSVLGVGSSFIAHPDGNLTAYLASLDTLLTAATPSSILAPGHGPVGGDARAAVEQYRAHRAERLTEVRAVLETVGEDASVEDVIAHVYSDVCPELRPAVEAVVRAQLAHLRADAGPENGA